MQPALPPRRIAPSGVNMPGFVSSLEVAARAAVQSTVPQRCKASADVNMPGSISSRAITRRAAVQPTLLQRRQAVTEVATRPKQRSPPRSHFFPETANSLPSSHKSAPRKSLASLSAPSNAHATHGAAASVVTIGGWGRLKPLLQLHRLTRLNPRVGKVGRHFEMQVQYHEVPNRHTERRAASSRV